MNKVIIFSGASNIVQEGINQFLLSNKDTEITNILQSCTSHYLYVSIFYIEKK